MYPQRAAVAAGEWSGSRTVVRRARSLLDRLEPRILDAAFRGDLVPHDAADEPAEAALVRLREITKTSTGPGAAVDAVRLEDNLP